MPQASYKDYPQITKHDDNQWHFLGEVDGYMVECYGEGFNVGNITYSAVRDRHDVWRELHENCIADNSERATMIPQIIEHVQFEIDL